MKNLFVIACVVALLGIPAHVRVDDTEAVFAIYLVRHAEKEPQGLEPGNPPLSFCGKLRAGALAQSFSAIGLEKIYSTPYERTLGTARPSAELHGLEIESYDPGELEEFARLLIERRQDALVVGHSNTTPVLAGLLAGHSEEAFDETIYDRLYQVVIAGGQARLNLFHQAFYCDS